MKKLAIVLVVVLIFILTSCSQPKNKRPIILDENTSDVLSRHSTIETTIAASLPPHDETNQPLPDTGGNIKFNGSSNINDYSKLGFELMDKETLGDLRIGLPQKDVISAMGEPEEKSELIEWGADGLEHQTWFYKEAGLEVWMVKSKNEWMIYAITINSVCKLKTSRNIGVGSTWSEVAEAYKNEIDPSKLKDRSSEIIAGTIYGGISFGFTEGRVSRILIGAGAE